MTPKEYAIKALPLIQAMAEGKTIQLKTEKGTWEARDTPTGVFEFEDVEYRVAPDDPMEEWRLRLLETFIKRVPDDRRAGIAGRFNEVFAQRPPQKTMMSAAQVREVWGLIYVYAARCIDAAKLGSSTEALKERTRAHTVLSEWFKANSCD